MNFWTQWHCYWYFYCLILHYAIPRSLADNICSVESLCWNVNFLTYLIQWYYEKILYYWFTCIIRTITFLPNFHPSWQFCACEAGAEIYVPPFWHLGSFSSVLHSLVNFIWIKRFCKPLSSPVDFSWFNGARRHPCQLPHCHTPEPIVKDWQVSTFGWPWMISRAKMKVNFRTVFTS